MAKSKTVKTAKKAIAAAPKKKAKAKPAAKPAAKTKKKATSLPAVRVRMFRQGLGDCFLLTFHVGGDERLMLIDCGSLGSKLAKPVKPADIAAIINKTIGPKGRLHVVVATHEHQDHLSGFNNKEMQALQGKVDHVWLA